MPTNNIGIEGMKWDGNDWIEAPPATPPKRPDAMLAHEVSAAVLAEWKRTLEPQFDKALYWATPQTVEQFTRTPIRTRQRGE